MLVDLNTPEGRQAARDAGLPVPPEKCSAGEEGPRKAGGTLELILPWPPSVNHYWRHVGNKVLISEQGREYRQHVGYAAAGRRLSGNLVGFGSARLMVRIIAYPPDKRARDLDNLFKAVLDSLQHAGVYESDSQIDDLSIVREPDLSEGGQLFVRITTLENPCAPSS